MKFAKDQVGWISSRLSNALWHRWNGNKGGIYYKPFCGSTLMAPVETCMDEQLPKGSSLCQRCERAAERP